MSTKQETVDFILEQLTQLRTVTAKKMFGEYALYYEGKVVGLVCDDTLFIKITEQGASLLGKKIAYGNPYPGSKVYFKLDDQLDDSELLCQLIEITAAHVKPPKKR